MSRGYRPEGCNPPETCFTCRHPDCKNESIKITSTEAAYERAGFTREYTPAYGPNKNRDMKRRIREATGRCIYCGKPLTAEDGEHKSCAACREAYRAKYRECKKISRAQGAAERK